MITVIVFIVLNTLFISNFLSTPKNNQKSEKLYETTYNPIINPSDFTSKITNKYFTLSPGKKMVYEGNTKDGLEKIETYVTNETRMVNEIETTVVWDRVWLDGELIEETFDWYAQDKEGNVWYFGEDSKEFENGKVVSTKGSWETGINGAKPGIIMKANPKVGDSYRQEYYKGEAEDMADVVSLGEKVIVPFGTFNNCIKTLDYTPLDPDLKENKYYCSEVGGATLEISLTSGEKVELISIE